VEDGDGEAGPFARDRARPRFIVVLLLAVVALCAITAIASLSYAVTVSSSIEGVSSTTRSPAMADAGGVHLGGTGAIGGTTGRLEGGGHDKEIGRGDGPPAPRGGQTTTVTSGGQPTAAVGGQTTTTVGGRTLSDGEYYDASGSVVRVASRGDDNDFDNGDDNDDATARERRDGARGGAVGTTVSFVVSMTKGYSAQGEPGIHRQRVPESGALAGVRATSVSSCEMVCTLINGRTKAVTISRIPWTDEARGASADGWVAWFSVYAQLEPGGSATTTTGAYVVVSSHHVGDAAYAVPQTCTLTITHAA
jgi:hypothetical protein